MESVPYLPTLLLVGMMMLISATTSAAETAFLSVSRAALYQRSRKGEARAITALNLVSHPEKMLTTILLINTMVNIASSALITSLLVKIFGDVGVAYATIGMSILILIFGEALPKSVGSRFSEGLTLTLAPVFTRLITICIPATWLINHLNTFVLNLFGLHKDGTHGRFTENDIRGAINLGLEHGALKKNEHRMLDAVLDLDDLTVTDVMVHRSAIDSLDINIPPSEIPTVLANLKHSRVPVFENAPDNIIGFLYVRDYLNALGKVSNRSQIKLRDHLRPTYFVPEITPAGHQLFEFIKHRTHLALVVDEYGDVQGLITLEDILEEIVGDIADEHDRLTDEERSADGVITLPGRLPIRDANRRYNWKLPEDDAVTLAGLMIDKLHHLPAQGESVIIAGLTLSVASKRGQRIERIRLTPVPKALKSALNNKK